MVIKMDEIVTSDLSRFGYREKEMASELLKAHCSSEHDITKQLGSDVRVYMNTHSGYMFLSDGDYNVAMMNGDYLEDVLVCSECGNEGFVEEIEDSDNECCKQCLVDYQSSW